MFRTVTWQIIVKSSNGCRSPAKQAQHPKHTKKSLKDTGPCPKGQANVSPNLSPSLSCLLPAPPTGSHWRAPSQLLRAFTPSHPRQQEENH